MRLSTALAASANLLLLLAAPARANEYDEDVCANRAHSLGRRDVDVSGQVGANINLPSVGVSIGNITTKLGNINLTVTDVTIATGDIEVSDIHVGNITVIVSVPLPGASPISAFQTQGGGQAQTAGGSSSGSGTTTSGAPASTGASASATTTDAAAAATGGAAGFLGRRQAAESSTRTIDLASASSVPSSTGPGLPDVSAGVGAQVGVSGGPINAGVGNIYTEIGNITITVDRVNVSLGSVKISNITIGNIFIYVQIGQPDLTGAIGNLSNTLGNIGGK